MNMRNPEPTNPRDLLWIAVIVAASLMWCLWPARAHEHQAGESAEQARVVDFYRTWLRPKGDFSITHRFSSCCYAMGMNQDCFPVLAERKDAQGMRWIMLDAPNTQFTGQWYRLDHGIEENKQPDPRGSPDGRSHACIAPAVGIVVCYVPGYGG
jgi:hypothetical protein